MTKNDSIYIFPFFCHQLDRFKCNIPAFVGVTSINKTNCWNKIRGILEETLGMTPIVGQQECVGE